MSMPLPVRNELCDAVMSDFRSREGGRITRSTCLRIERISDVVFPSLSRFRLAQAHIEAV